MAKNTNKSKSAKSKNNKASKAKKAPAKKSASKKAVAKKAAPAPAPVAEPETNEVVSNNVEEKELSVLEVHNQKFQEILSNIQALKSQLIQVTSQVKALQKTSEKDIKKFIKQTKKNTRKAKSRAPSGFVKPARISKELASFLGKPVGTEMARTEVTREINTYIRSHNLQDPNNGRIIKADKKLRTLLNLKKEDELTYFNLQRYMSPHFAKKGHPVV